MPEDDVEISFPVEVVLEGMPVSFQARGSRSHEQWKQRVAAAAREARGGDQVLLGLEPVAATIFIFPAAEMQGDIDNVVKPILDSLTGVVYPDDRQVERLVVQKFEPGRIAEFVRPTIRLVEVLETPPPVVYIRIDDDGSRGGLVP